MFSFCRSCCSSSSYSAIDYSLWSPSNASSSKSSSPVHAASLVDPLAHSPELLQLLDMSFSPSVIDYLVECISEVVDDALACAGVKSSSSSRSRFASFISKVLSRADVTPPTVLVALAYLDRAAPYLCIGRAEWADERVFLGAIICASKYTNDSSLRNTHWGLCTGVFGKRDIGRIEREFLDVLEWRLRVTEQDLLVHRQGLMRAAGMRVNAVHWDQLERSVRPLPRRPQHQRSYSSSSTSSIGSVPSLSPTSSPDSLLLSPSPSPRTPPPHLPDVPMDVDVDLDVDLEAEMYGIPPIAKPKKQMRSLPRALPIQRPGHVAVPLRRPLPHPYSHPQPQLQSQSRARRLV
ncbi:hypothetical protein FB45DRAFT_802915 [Roridomyces roridus]|uniref:Cyclin N-terminal domain-containing protein n=1 Tax=Roridomyces roridus TaxID=1738132 RepID=A0AAD7FDU9_9AGAR|nr:hypothetical protein FB45DRAFT_802915 [Roridomyces roridus]